MSTFPELESSHDWRPCCDLQALRQRAAMLAQIRRFFAQREVMEVETPLLGAAVNPDPHVAFFAVADGERTYYLQTSPELAMKRLLAAGSGSIYQIGKAFRRGESGRLHQPEFTLLEWYRLDFTLEQLMDEVATLLQTLLEERISGTVTFTYEELFREYVGLSWQAPLSSLRAKAESMDIPDAARVCGDDRRHWLDLLFSLVVQPRLPDSMLVFVHEYPACMAALARCKPDNPGVAERFEVFVNGVELGNGYRELTDVGEQSQRFRHDLELRRSQGLALPPLDQAFLAALAAGMPECSGVAIGLDRVLMLKLGRQSIAEVLPFPLQAFS